MTIPEALEAADGQDDSEAKRHPPLVVKAEALRVLAAEVRRLNAMRCETCKHRQCYGDYEECDRTQGDDYGNRTECKTMGGGCLAWEKRDA